MSHWIYSAVLVSIAASVLGISVGTVIIRRVLRYREKPRPIIAWLLFVLLAMSLAQFVEQSRVLVFRLSYDGFIRTGIFSVVYGAAWNVVSSKVLMSVALTTAAAVKLGLYCDRPDHQIVKWAAAAAIATLGAWAVLAYIIEDIMT